MLNKYSRINSHLFKYFNHLGSFSPYYTKKESGQMSIETNYSRIISRLDSSMQIDPVAIIEILSKRYMLGDRTILRNVFRSPWMAKLNESTNTWDFFNISKHHEFIENEKIIAEGLFKLLCQEVKTYIGDANKIGILLSGGMDSRMVAGVLDYLIGTNQIKVCNVTAYTWGNANSRDVVYAREIASRLKWNWKHFVVSSSDLWENFRIAGERGCEYSGLHLHAIPQIKNDIGVQLILAGSFGDSIGRAEYQGVHLRNLSPINMDLKNFANLFTYKEFNKIRNLWSNDIDLYHSRFSRSKPYQQHELDYQLHYMRRMLNPCMEILNEVVPLHQVFTNPSVFQYMWGFSPKCRNDKVYCNLMKFFITDLTDIPWSRTGLPFGKTEGKPDLFSRNHHSYYNFIQNELIDKIEVRVLSQRIMKLGLFNFDSIKVLLKLIKKYPDNNIDYLERITWLVSLDIFLEKFYNGNSIYHRQDIIDIVAASILTPIRYLLLRVYRRIKY